MALKKSKKKISKKKKKSKRNIWKPEDPDLKYRVKKVKRREPYKYDPDFHPKDLLQFMEKGKSYSEWAGRVSINRDTVYEWKKTHPEFKKAMKEGWAMAIGYWENRLARCEQKYGIPFQAVIFILKTRFHRDYKDPAKKFQISGQNGGPIQTEQKLKIEKMEDALRRIKSENESGEFLP